MAGASVYTVDDGRGHCTGSADLHRNPHAVRRPRRLGLHVLHSERGDYFTVNKKAQNKSSHSVLSVGRFMSFIQFP